MPDLQMFQSIDRSEYQSGVKSIQKVDIMKLNDTATFQFNQMNGDQLMDKSPVVQEPVEPNKYTQLTKYLNVMENSLKSAKNNK